MSEITEDYVSFETARLLKEKGFNIPTCSFTRIDWWPDRNIHYVNYVDNWNNQPEIFVSVPTFQMAMKWLREVHNLVIQVELIDFLEHGEVWFYTVIERKNIKQLTGRDGDFTEHSYEEACEAAIKYCIEHLI